MDRELVRCPACESDRFWGAPVGYKTDGSRCGLCRGWGVTTQYRIFTWELSL